MPTDQPIASITPAPVTTAATTAPPDYVFPISPADVATYGRTHHDYPASDVFAPCGSDVVAPTSGVVDEISREDVWVAGSDDPAVRGGLSITIVGDDGVRYYASHLLDILPAVVLGLRVAAGELIAHVGDTGNAAGTGCHVHFGLSPDCGPGDWAVRRGTIYPWPFLDAWRDVVQVSPVKDVHTWLIAHPDQCATPAE